MYTKEDGMTVFKTKENVQLQDNIITEMDICTLKIRNEQGEVFILHLSRGEYLREVYSWMRKVCRQRFVLMSNFPRKSYEEY